jgi:hypothetical protein
MHGASGARECAPAAATEFSPASGDGRGTRRPSGRKISRPPACRALGARFRLLCRSEVPVESWLQPVFDWCGRVESEQMDVRSGDQCCDIATSVRGLASTPKSSPPASGIPPRSRPALPLPPVASKYVISPALLSELHNPRWENRPDRVLSRTVKFVSPEADLGPLEQSLPARHNRRLSRGTTGFSGTR